MVITKCLLLCNLSPIFNRFPQHEADKFNRYICTYLYIRLYIIYIYVLIYFKDDVPCVNLDSEKPTISDSDGMVFEIAILV